MLTFRLWLQTPYEIVDRLVVRKISGMSFANLNFSRKRAAENIVNDKDHAAQKIVPQTAFRKDIHKGI